MIYNSFRDSTPPITDLLMDQFGTKNSFSDYNHISVSTNTEFKLHFLGRIPFIVSSEITAAPERDDYAALFSHLLLFNRHNFFLRSLRFFVLVCSL